MIYLMNNAGYPASISKWKEASYCLTDAVKDKRMKILCLENLLKNKVSNNCNPIQIRMLDFIGYPVFFFLLFSNLQGSGL